MHLCLKLRRKPVNSLACPMMGANQRLNDLSLALGIQKLRLSTSAGMVGDMISMPMPYYTQSNGVDQERQTSHGKTNWHTWHHLGSSINVCCTCAQLICTAVSQIPQASTPNVFSAGVCIGNDCHKYSLASNYKKVTS